jgi:hypothetical protein
MEIQESDVVRLLSKVEWSHPLGCWVYTGGISPNGYGRFWLNGKTVSPHRMAYIKWIGPIPGGYVIDHLCRTPSCLNPWHLEAVTQSVNVIRGNSTNEGGAAYHRNKTHCPQGHEYNAENTSIVTRRSGTERRCKACSRERWRKRSGYYDKLGRRPQS